MTVQHVFGIATAVLCSVLLLRWGVWRWLAVLAACPVLLEHFVDAAEHLLLGDALSALLVVAAVLAFSWRQRPSRAAALAGAALLCLALVVGGTAGWSHDAKSGYLSLFPAVAPLSIGCLALGLLGALGVGRAHTSQMRAVCLLTAGLPAGILLVAAVTAQQSGWHALVAVALWPISGALGLSALLRGRRAPSAATPQVDPHDRDALADFRERYGDPRLAPVTVVIAAYNEGGGLPLVLSSLPRTVCGLAADIVVVDDGSTDGTSDGVAREDAYLVRSSVNRGQGAALRLGYRVAREGGARFIVTTDADGQYDPADISVVLAPILEGRADFVSGSRRLGRQETQDRFRRAGVYVFAWITSALTGQWFTDTSFGLRAMRAEVTETVTLNQPQYQSSELLIGTYSHRFRIAEVPGRMRVRAIGSTKKGGNLVYGARYARVVFGTWWREGCPVPVRECAPALRKRPGPQ